MKDIDISELDLNNIVSWPMPIKIMFIVILSMFILFLGYGMDTKKQLVQLEVAQQEALNLRTTFESKKSKANNIKADKGELVWIKRSLGDLVRQLSQKNEIPGLIEDITHQGLSVGLEFRTIRLLPEKEIDFYAELPIEISVVGNYHQFGDFVSRIAAFPRIITLHDFSIHPLTPEGNDLVMNILAKTYRYMLGDYSSPPAWSGLSKASRLGILDTAYKSSKLRNPFEPSLSMKIANPKIVGMLEKQGKKWAIVEEKDGTVHRVRDEKWDQ